jgi:anti-anti-sigma factor
MSVLARIEEQAAPAEGVSVVAIEGEIDASNVLEVGEHLRSLLTNRSTALVVDLSPTTYLDSAAINLFFGLGADLAQRQQHLLLVIPASAPIARAITITGLDAAVPVHPTREDAVGRAAGG